uniref:Uncharacterized protein n=1 Tax=Manihot esculenta TaxID=3983 RepID=A0A2C9VYB8_MANES
MCRKDYDAKIIVDVDISSFLHTWLLFASYFCRRSKCLGLFRITFWFGLDLVDCSPCR